MTKQFALIGHPLNHTISPFVHERLFALNNLIADYKLFDISKDELNYSISILKKLDGYNVTVPYKIEILKYIDKVDELTKICGASNTIKNDGKISKGFNTDGLGFLKAIENSKLNLFGDILILGCGGAAYSIASQCIKFCKSLTIAIRNTSLKKAVHLKKILELKNGFSKDIKIVLLDKLKGKFNVLINTTPVGMFPNHDMLPISKNILKNCKYVFDAIYNPCDTMLIKNAKANGSITLGGLSMLVWQAAISHEIWYNAVFCFDDINNIIEDSRIEIRRKFS